VGTYLFGDFGSGRIWGLRYDGVKVTEVKVIASTNLGISAFAEDEEGELYVLALEGSLSRLIPLISESETFPLKLSETGCFSQLNPLKANPRLVPYEVNSPLWSDGTEKERFLFVPTGKKIKFHSEEAWQFPQKTVLVKSFFVPKSGSRQIIETRFLVRESNGFLGYSYRWNDEGTEAFLLGGAAHREVDITEQGVTEHFLYYYPSSSDCLRCHTKSVGEVLGVHTLQVHLKDQIKAFVDRGLIELDSLPPDLSQLKKLPVYTDSSLDNTSRARAFLHSQCAHCHNPLNVAGQVSFDMRFSTPLSHTLMCDALPQHGDLGIEGARVISPGKPGHSVIFKRIQSLDPHVRMPPLASSRQDKVAIPVTEKWIKEIPGCP
jgi:uncharacterized repeat protein (TIGR03806 family)